MGKVGEMLEEDKIKSVAASWAGRQSNKRGRKSESFIVIMQTEMSVERWHTGMWSDVITLLVRFFIIQAQQCNQGLSPLVTHTHIKHTFFFILAELEPFSEPGVCWCTETQEISVRVFARLHTCVLILALTKMGVLSQLHYMCAHPVRCVYVIKVKDRECPGN